MRRVLRTTSLLLSLQRVPQVKNWYKNIRKKIIFLVIHVIIYTTYNYLIYNAL